MILYDKNTETADLIFKVIFLTYLLTLNLLNCLALQYLFFYQGQKMNPKLPSKKPKIDNVSEAVPQMEDLAAKSLEML
jgi:hypothetical protein